MLSCKLHAALLLPKPRPGREERPQETLAQVLTKAEQPLMPPGGAEGNYSLVTLTDQPGKTCQTACHPACPVLSTSQKWLLSQRRIQGPTAHKVQADLHIPSKHLCFPHGVHLDPKQGWGIIPLTAPAQRWWGTGQCWGGGEPAEPKTLLRGPWDGEPQRGN